MKRLLDIVVSLLGLILFGPVLLATALFVRWFLGSPVLFAQERIGLNGKFFQMYKFRTMTDERDEEGNLLPDHRRLTSFGKWLRATSLDELPELFVILKGDMSLVGPRPLLPRYLPRYSKEQARRHEVKPGLTGWAQVNGRNAISWPKKFKLDVWYVDHQSIWLDLKILFLTVWMVFKKEGISAKDDATMPEFTGLERDESEREEEPPTHK
jgi:sugar transferase EpsL